MDFELKKINILTIRNWRYIDGHFADIYILQESWKNGQKGELQKLAKGFVIGYRLYNNYGITTQVSKIIEIYSNILEEEKKTIKNIQIKKINLLINSEIKKAIEQLEILQHYSEIEDVIENGFRSFISTISESYSNEVFINVLSKIKYMT